MFIIGTNYQRDLFELCGVYFPIKKFKAIDGVVTTEDLKAKLNECLTVPSLARLTLPFVSICLDDCDSDEAYGDTFDLVALACQSFTADEIVACAVKLWKKMLQSYTRNS